MGVWLESLCCPSKVESVAKIYTRTRRSKHTSEGSFILHFSWLIFEPVRHSLYRLGSTRTRGYGYGLFVCSWDSVTYSVAPSPRETSATLAAVFTRKLGPSWPQFFSETLATLVTVFAGRAPVAEIPKSPSGRPANPERREED